MNEEDGLFYPKPFQVGSIRTDGKSNIYDVLIFDEIKKIRAEGGEIGCKQNDLECSSFSMLHKYIRN